MKVNFGSSGDTYASATVLAPEVTALTIASAWLYPKATDDHTIEEHIATPIRVIAGACTAGVGFTIYAIVESDNPAPMNRSKNAKIPTVTGQWFVAVDY